MCSWRGQGRPWYTALPTPLPVWVGNPQSRWAAMEISCVANKWTRRRCAPSRSASHPRLLLLPLWLEQLSRGEEIHLLETEVPLAMELLPRLGGFGGLSLSPVWGVAPQRTRG
jgi:hypothetical protein